jgi:hypothetical protein
VLPLASSIAPDPFPEPTAPEASLMEPDAELALYDAVSPVSIVMLPESVPWAGAEAVPSRSDPEELPMLLPDSIVTEPPE